MNFHKVTGLRRLRTFTTDKLLVNSLGDRNTRNPRNLVTGKEATK